MSDEFSRDGLDDRLGDALRSIGAGTDDTRSVLHAMGPRFAAAQRRRRAAIAGATALATMSLVGAAAALSGGGGARVDTIPPATDSSTDNSGPTLTDDGGPISSVTSPGSSPTTSTPTDSVAPPTSSGSSGSTATTGSTSATNPGTNPGTSPTTSPTTAPTTATTSPAPELTKTCSDTFGNSIRVQWNGSALSLLSATANTAAGWVRAPEDDVFESDRIRIRFELDGDGHRITARWSSGTVECSVS